MQTVLEMNLQKITVAVQQRSRAALSICGNLYQMGQWAACY